MTGWRDAGAAEAAKLVGQTLRLEAQRIVAIAEADAAAIVEIDRDLDATLGGLERRGVAYPGHVVGARYELAGAEYAVLVLALLPHHAPDALEVLARALGDDVGPDWRPIAKLHHALALLGPESAWPELRARLADGPLCGEGLVSFAADEDDPPLRVHAAILELYGFDPTPQPPERP